MPKKNSLKIIYEDEYLLIVDKPANMLVVPSEADSRHDLTFFLNEQLKARGLTVKAHPCHRLDRETSGLVVFAKGKKNQQVMMELFQRRQIKKIYLAFIQGYLKKKRGKFRSYIANAWPYDHKEEKKLAVTRFELIAKGDGFSVIKFEPVTGRTNQIRIQCRDMGHPLLGERRFAFAKDWPIKFRRVALHAFSIEFIHPFNKSNIFLKSHLPEDMQAFLGKYGISFPGIYLNL